MRLSAVHIACYSDLRYSVVGALYDAHAQYESICGFRVTCTDRKMAENINARLT